MNTMFDWVEGIALGEILIGFSMAEGPFGR
jgi:hypothetical protein